MSSLPNKYWLIIIAALFLVLLSGSIILGINLYNHRPLEISLTQQTLPEYPLEIYICGAVQNPGYYPIAEDDSITTLIYSVRLATDADLKRIKISIPENSDSFSPQRININRAECSLIEALPGIGPTKAQEIIDYRDKNGPFRRIDELVKVNCISKTTLTKIKELITIED